MPVSFEKFLDWINSKYTSEHVILIEAFGSVNEPSLKKLEHLRGHNLILGDCYGGKTGESDSATRNIGEFRGMKLQTINDLRVFDQATLNDDGNEVSWGPRPHIFDPEGATLRDDIWIPIAATIYSAAQKKLEIKFYHDGNKYLPSTQDF